MDGLGVGAGVTGRAGVGFGVAAMASCTAACARIRSGAAREQNSLPIGKSAQSNATKDTDYARIWQNPRMHAIV